ncbi:hypothetical protein [Arundinibacter roseus]|uniref:DUF3618 domain-containing protein n=1 Tax=Arundinibacter roseus TaxID=2070510 RepID=A0A4R4KQ29_9BACT|nr:hypothetical protein [Arundinibacter roseus]TDB69046.1 hypothetical protein EZE20_01550 [Arundinibacter roseus]
MSLLSKHTQPFSSDTHRQKEELKAEVDEFRQRLDAQWADLQTNALHYGKQALVIGGVIASVYVLLEALLPNEEETQPIPMPERPARVQNRDEFQIGSALRSLAWTLAVGWARQQLSHYIEAENKPDAARES